MYLIFFPKSFQIQLSKHTHQSQSVGGGGAHPHQVTSEWLLDVTPPHSSWFFIFPQPIQGFLWMTDTEDCSKISTTPSWYPCACCDYNDWWSLARHHITDHKTSQRWNKSHTPSTPSWSIILSNESWTYKLFLIKYHHKNWICYNGNIFYYAFHPCWLQYVILVKQNLHIFVGMHMPSAGQGCVIVVMGCRYLGLDSI